MSIDFPLGDDLAGYIAEAIAADPSFKGTLEDAEEARRLVDALIALRKHCQLSQVEVAKRMGVRQPTVSGFEKEPSDPKLSTLQRYAVHWTPGCGWCSKFPRFAKCLRGIGSPLIGAPHGTTRSGWVQTRKS